MGSSILFDDVSILIIGFDGYKDVWDRDIELMNKYWPNRPKTYLADSELRPDYEGVEVINAGPDSEWSKKVQVALDKIDTKYVILLLEDFFITDKVNNDVLESIMETVENDGIKFYQLLVQLFNQRWEKGKPYKKNRDIKIIPAEKKYGINLQAAIWEKDFLKECVGAENYNAWLFEINQLGTKNYNVDKIEYLIDVRNVLNITHAVVQSKYLRAAKRKMKSLGMPISEEERAQMSFGDNFKYQFKLIMYSLTPRFLVSPAKAIGRLMKVDFVTDRIK